MTVVRLRPAGPADRAAIGELAGRVFARYGDYAAILGDWLREPGVEARVAAAGDRVVGFVSWAFVRAEPESPPEGRVLALAVDAEHRRRGLGRRLLREAITALDRDAPAVGARRIRLEVAHDNVAARSLFAAEGFSPLPGAGGRYPGGPRYETLIRLVRPVSSGTRE